MMTLSIKNQPVLTKLCLNINHLLNTEDLAVEPRLAVLCNLLKCYMQHEVMRDSDAAKELFSKLIACVNVELDDFVKEQETPEPVVEAEEPEEA